MPFRPRAPKAYRRKGQLLDHPNNQHSDPDQMSMEGGCNIRYKCLSLHTGVAIKGEDRDGLKRLFHYAARSSVAVSQLSYVTPEKPDRSEMELRFKRSGRDGTGSLVLTQRDFVEKLASLVPPPGCDFEVFIRQFIWLVMHVRRAQEILMLRKEVQLLIEMKTNNRRWGARRIVGGLRKLGKIISKSTVLNILKESGFLDRSRRRDESW